MLLPDAERAFADDSKFVDYCLNPAHPIGKHKARVFAASLRIGLDNWPVLRDAVLLAVLTWPAVHQGRNGYGELYVVDFLMEHDTRTALVRTSWIIHDDENFPRLTSCYVID
jgi:hypothetical protein